MYDVAIIGAGITGCAIAYELGKYNVKAVIVEKENDVSVGTTKANSAIIHGGYDPKLNKDGRVQYQRKCLYKRIM